MEAVIMAVLDLKNKKFNRLLVLERAENTKSGKSRWLCQCDCGKKTIVLGSYIKDGRVKSCGCYNHDLLIKRNTKHNYDGKRICYVYRSMLSRCLNKNNKYYSEYGGRGIDICDEWIGENGIKNFCEWAYANGYDENAPRGQCTLDRIDNDKGYSPANCRWVDLYVQANNKRNNILINYNGKTQTLEQWCKELKLSRSMVRHRYERGCKISELFAENKRKSKR